MTRSDSPLPVFDGHNDVLSKLYVTHPLDPAAAFINGYEAAIDLPKSRAGGFAGGFFAVYIPPLDVDHDARTAAMMADSYALPLPPQLDWSHAVTVTMTQINILLELERHQALTICRDVDDLRAAMAAGTIAAIMHIEGAEAIDADLDMLDVLHAGGLRSIGPVWSRQTIFGHGVPFAFPASPDTGPGLTEAGLRLVKRCDELGILIDLSHMNEAGFWDVARHSTKPLVATHSNVHAICQHARNLTDDQLRAIRDSGGMVGLNFATAFLRPDGKMAPEVPLDLMLRHLDHLIGILGEDHVGLGSDYDGAVMPQSLASAADLPRLVEAMHQHGYGDDLITGLCAGNWLSILDTVWN
ncbi:MAG: dipeptidase [Candidatus Puniceispirillaceae bacterium]